MLNFKEIFSVTLILFSVIDIVGSIPIVIDLRKKNGVIESEKATLVAGALMVIFLFVGESILKLFGVDVQSFAVAGAIIVFLIGMEMILGRHIFRPDTDTSASSIVPLAFPLIAGTMTTIISLRAEYTTPNILVGVLLNLVIVYIVLRSSEWIGRKLGTAGTEMLRKVFGIILIAIAIKLITSNLGIM